MLASRVKPALKAQLSFSVTEPLSNTDRPMTKSSKRMEPFLSMSKALNRKWAYVVASVHKRSRACLTGLSDVDQAQQSISMLLILHELNVA
ncbi:hypothetical protein EYF80_022931 [Liparis tanakae]|uniref:Uncharacterized protein n=1 Tax=Liparis tanakae TaxID=230148 RepID=A0A4Z2HQ13_9TELE|nr:hypothetical protein EYF80_022931 [Liparis tanakae]